jgi:hypothetical protein
MKVFVKKQNCDPIKLILKKSDSIRTVNNKVNEKKQIDPDQQILQFNGKKLHDDYTLSDYNIG